MLQVIERKAEISISRGCGFAAIGIGTFMVGLSGDLGASFKGGGLLVLLMSLILLLKAWYVDRQHYKQTEVWLMLAEGERPHETIAQQVISNVIREVCLRFAWHAAVLAALLLAMAYAHGWIATIRG